jgi:non-specific serine/threonine protein kinase
MCRLCRSPISSTSLLWRSSPSVQDTLTIARSLSYLGVLGLYTKEWDRSHRRLEEALTYWQEAQHAWGIAYTLLYLGAIELMQEHREEAVRLLEESLAGYREIGDESARGLALLWLAGAIAERGEILRAAILLQELLELSSQAQDRRLMYLCAAGVAWLLRDQGDPEQLARLLGAAQQLRETMRIVRGVVFRTRVVISIATETLQARLGQESFEAALAEGRSLSFQQMAALILLALDGAAQVGAPTEAAQEPRHPSILSPREHEVLQLVAEGFSNKQIAKELIIAESTAKYYVTSIFNKLGVDTRAQAVAVAAQRGLL